jgi:hypothetical protein
LYNADVGLYMLANKVRLLILCVIAYWSGPSLLANYHD